MRVAIGWCSLICLEFVQTYWPTSTDTHISNFRNRYCSISVQSSAQCIGTSNGDICNCSRVRNRHIPQVISIIDKAARPPGGRVAFQRINTTWVLTHLYATPKRLSHTTCICIRSIKSNIGNHSTYILCFCSVLEEGERCREEKRALDA